MGNTHIHVNNDVEKLRIDMADLERKVADLERNLYEIKIRCEKESTDKEEDDELELESVFSGLHTSEGNSVDNNNPVTSISNAQSAASFDVLDECAKVLQRM